MHLPIGQHCEHAGKHPRGVENWKTDASNDSDVVRAWSKKYPQANYGIHIGASGLIVLDFDTAKPEYDGAELLAELQASHPTTTVRTGSGGYHLLYKMPAGLTLGNETGDLPACVDVRGDGGYVVVAGSLHASGNRYTWQVSPWQLAPAPLPDLVLALIQTPKSAPQNNTVGATAAVPSLDDAALLAKARANARTGVDFVRLFDAGDLSAYGGDHSSADQALCRLLAWWCNCDPAAIDRLFRQSALYRPKWERQDYRDGTIQAAIDYVRQRHGSGYTGAPAPDPAAVAAAQAAVGAQNNTSGGSGQQTTQGRLMTVNLLIHPADDAGHATTFLEMHPNEFLYSDAFGWLHWTGTHWQAEGAEAVLHQEIVSMLRARRVAAVQAPTPIEGLIKSCAATRSRVQGVAFCVKMHVYAAADTFDRDPDLLNVANGLLHLPTGTLRPHDPAERLTYCLATPYDENADYSRWTDFLHTVIADPAEVVPFLQMFLGYAMTGHTNEECLLYAYGKARAGKGTLTEVILELVGRPLAQAVQFSTFLKRREAGDQGFDLAPLRPARLIIAGESNQSDRLNSGTIKGLTGGDTITASFKHHDQFSFRPIFKAILVSNHQANGDPDDPALWGRVRIVEFPNSWLGNEDKSLKASLKSPDALRGVLRWLAEGARQWYAAPNGLVAPDAVTLATERHRADLDTVQQWLDTCCRIDRFDPKVYTPTSTLFASYKTWCTVENNTQAVALAHFGRSLNRKGFRTGVQHKVGGRPTRCVDGIEIT